MVTNKMIKNIIFILTILFSLYNINIAHSQSVESPLSYQGGASSLLYGTDTIVLENTIIDDGTISNKHDTIGIRHLHSQYYKLSYIPIIIPLTDNFVMDFTLPYISKSYVINSLEYEKSGFGDIKLGITGVFEPIKGLDSISSIKTTFPTGDAVSRDGTTLLPLGYGSNTFSFLQTFSINYSAIRLFFNGGIQYFLKSIRDINDTEQYTFDKTYLFSFMAGAEYSISLFSFQFKSSYINSAERKYKYEDSSAGTSTDWQDFNDAFETINLIGAIKADFNELTSCSVMYIYPVYEKQDSDINDTTERQWELYFSFERKLTTTSYGKARSRRRR